MKELWVDVRPWKKELATTAIEAGADALVVEEAAKVRVLGRIKTVAPDGDLVPGKEVFFIEIKGKEGETEAVERSRQGIAVVRTKDWTVIPLENLVAQSDRIIAEVNSLDQAEVALHVLEKGVHGILLSTRDPAIIRQVAASMKSGLGCTGMIPFTVTAIKPLGMGDRVCVDTCSLLSDGDGMLVGNTSSGFLLVHAETLENPYVAPRPFRVNAGAVHAYIMLPDGKTAYLSDLKSGDHVVVAEASGCMKDAIVGRVKIERRPLLLVEAEAEGSKVSLVLQNAETIRLVSEDGSARSVVDLEPGDRIMGRPAESGRHFGIAVKEHILEK